MPKIKYLEIMDRFITYIELKDFLGKLNLSIPLSDKIARHLIITGKNRSGKTALISTIADHLLTTVKYSRDMRSLLDDIKNVRNSKTSQSWDLSDVQNYYQQYVDSSNGVMLSFSRLEPDWVPKDLFFLFFDSKRISKIEKPVSIQKIDIVKEYGMHDRVESVFLNYLVNMAADRSFAKEANDIEVVKRIDQWFNNLEKGIGRIFGLDNLKLNFDRYSYNFEITADGEEPFFFDKLSDGYSAIVSIIVEILLRTESKLKIGEEPKGIVLIDELETHLHIELQKEILPFLIDFFPEIQFIVTTHSPFVMTSVANATVCDLEKKIVTTDLSNYSYEAIIESYFKSDKYSEVLKSKVERYEYLALKDKLDSDEKFEMMDLKEYLDSAPKFLSKELHSKLLEIEIKTKTNKLLK